VQDTASTAKASNGERWNIREGQQSWQWETRLDASALRGVCEDVFESRRAPMVWLPTLPAALIM